jgi:hypothetical protein
MSNALARYEVFFWGTPAYNERFCAIAAVSPLKILWGYCNIVPRRSVNKMPPLLQSRFSVICHFWGTPYLEQ